MAIMLCLMCSLHAFAGKTTYYYRATAYASPTGGGKVYVATQRTDSPSYQTVTNQGYSITGNVDTYARQGTTTFYYYAQENNGWIFDHWAKGSATGTNAGTNPSLTTEETFNSQSSNNPTQISYYAVFIEQTGYVKVQVAEAGRGTVSINNPNNTLNSQVVLTANPDASNGVLFLGWNKDRNDTENFISTTNPYSFTVTSETAGTYYAHFSEAAQNNYIRLRNNQTGRFLTLYGTSHATTHTRTYGDYENVADGFVFTNSLKMVSAEDAQGNPMTVFLRNGSPAGSGATINCELVANHTEYSDLVSADLTTNQYPLVFETMSNGSVRIYTYYTTRVNNENHTFKSYLCDEGNADGWLVMKTIENVDNLSGVDWTVYVLNENTTDGALGANTKAKFTKDGKYYTTMFTYFPYQLLDGVKAYYLPLSEESYNEETNSVVFTEFTSGRVPAETAVVLECDAVQNTGGAVADVKNRILPLPESAIPTEENVNPSLNLLKGYISMNGSTVANDPTLMYVLSSKNNKLGFYHSTSDNMSANKAYLHLPEAVDSNPLAATATFSFGQTAPGEGETSTGITLSEQQADEEDAAVYDLFGRKVADSAKDHLKTGVYISKGKKFIAK